MSTAEVATLIENHKNLTHDVNGLRQSVSNMNGSLLRIEKALTGDSEMMHVGIVKTVQAHQQMLDEMEQELREMKEEKELEDAKKKKDRWWITGIASAIGGACMWLINYFTK